MQNFTCGANATAGLPTNNSCAGPRHAGPRIPVYSETYIITATVLLSVLIPVIVLGNAFVILAFARTRKLRTMTNYFVVSLAIADILVGSLALPIFTVVINKGRLWQFQHPMITKLWTSVDMITTIASIINLMYISIDRFICIQFPFKYYTLLNKTRVVVMIVVSWIYGLLNSSLVMFTYEKQRPRPQVVLAVTVMAFILPLLVVMVMYGQVAKIAFSHRVRMNARELEKENEGKPNKGRFSLIRELKATRTLAVVIGAFVLCFLGYFVLWLRVSICVEWQSLNCEYSPSHAIAVTSFQWIKYFNSTLNPFIYALMNSVMRKALKRFVTGRIFATDSSSFELN